MQIETEAPEVLIVYGYKIEMYHDRVCVIDHTGKLTTNGARKLTRYLEKEDIRQQPFTTHVLKGI